MRLPNAVPKPKVKPKVRKPMKKYNAKRKGHAFPHNVDEGLRAFIRGLPCILVGRVRWANDMPWVPNAAGDPDTLSHRCWKAIQVCHVKNRGAGGKDRNNVYPGCAAAHDEQHCIGIPAFEKRWGVDLKVVARQLTEVYEAGLGVSPNEERE